MEEREPGQRLVSPDTRVVPSVSLDNLDCRPTLLKLDVEGGEDDVVRKGRGTLSKTHAIIIETVSDETHSALTEAGFIRASYALFKRLLSTASLVPTVPMSNSLYVRSFDFVFRHVESAPDMHRAAEPDELPCR